MWPARHGERNNDGLDPDDTRLRHYGMRARNASVDFAQNTSALWSKFRSEIQRIDIWYEGRVIPNCWTGMYLLRLSLRLFSHCTPGVMAIDCLLGQSSVPREKVVAVFTLWFQMDQIKGVNCTKFEDSVQSCYQLEVCLVVIHRWVDGPQGRVQYRYSKRESFA